MTDDPELTGDRARLFRSARCLSAWLEDGALRLANFASGAVLAAHPVVLELLQFFCRPASAAAAMRRFTAYTPASVGQAMVELLDAGLLLECGSEADARDAYLADHWRHWLPEGGAFHFMTKDAPYAPGGELSAGARAAILATAPPAPFKDPAGEGRIELPVCSWPDDAYCNALRGRRTCRGFSSEPLGLAVLAQLLHATWGVQAYVQSEDFGTLPVKTSPSGGARHPVEVYVMALRVDGLAPGVYHYHPRDHALYRLAAAASGAKARAWCADQPWVSEAAALFVMTGVFERVMWKYRHPRAYRIVLLDAGHLGQTFCLTATWLGLGAFSTAALADSLIERDLELDGIAESALYVTGCGVP